MSEISSNISSAARLADVLDSVTNQSVKDGMTDGIISILQDAISALNKAKTPVAIEDNDDD